jgi:hypothetical protein
MIFAKYGQELTKQNFIRISPTVLALGNDIANKLHVFNYFEDRKTYKKNVQGVRCSFQFFYTFYLKRFSLYSELEIRSIQ